MTALLRVGPLGDERPVLLDDDGRHWDLAPLTGDVSPAFLEDDGPVRAREAARAGRLRPADVGGLRVGAPVARPGAVVCIGQNYAAHAAESGSPPPERPIVFLKHPNTVVGPTDPILLPPGSTALDWEAELGVVFGRAAHRVPESSALDHVAGYLVGDDVSERTWQRQESGGQWSKGKISPSFCPLGPWLVPADEVDPTALHVWSRVNGEARQDSVTADMVFSVAALIADVSRYVRFDPGDVLLTGTPEGVAMSGRFPYLAAGDAVEVGIDGLGAQRSPVEPG